MKTIHNNEKRNRLIDYSRFRFLTIAMVIILFMSNCKKFVSIPPPINTLVPATVFENEVLADGAVLGIYRTMGDWASYASGGLNSISVFNSVISDEMIVMSSSSYENLSFAYQNDLRPDNEISNNIWAQAYHIIYRANTVIEGLNNSKNIIPTTKQKLKGEALFIRAFNYWYLTNMYGEIPLHLSTDYVQNRNVNKTSVSTVYTQIVNDLLEAEALLPEVNENGRTRVNKDVARALLARTYLYLRDWTKANEFASSVISKTSSYNIISLDDVFKKNSSEAIWQLIPPTATNTAAGFNLILNEIPNHIYTNPDFVETAFETNDERATSWIGVFTSGADKYYFPTKYKIRESATVDEYFMVLRLGEQYLIRAEARAQLNNLADAIADLDVLRKRAGLTLIKDSRPSINKEEALNLIAKERRIEMFSEWGDRWFDLKRNGKLKDVLLQTKPNWSSKNLVIPIPLVEVNYNRNITQNAGY